MEASMTRLAALTIVLCIVLVHGTPTWGGPPNPTPSDGNGNTAGGNGALQSVTPQGAYNTGFGFQALFNTTSGDYNTASGVGALWSNTTGVSNTAVGFETLYFNSTGSYNTAVGVESLLINASGNFNTAIGVGALGGNTMGSQNTASGLQALFNNTSGSGNTANGFKALFTNGIGSENTATGNGALFSNSTGTDNVADGVNALFNNTTGSQNTASGAGALNVNSTGLNNTAIGFGALSLSNGNKNVGIGYRAGANLQNGSNNIYVGHPGVGDESKTMRLGMAQTSTFIAGVASTNVGGATVVIDANGQLGVQFSSARYKRDVEAMGNRSAGVFQLRPVTFAYRDDAPGTVQYGLIAEEVAALYPELVTRTPTGEVQTVRYQALIPMLLNELQRQQQALQQEAAEVATLRKELAELRSLVGSGSIDGRDRSQAASR
jgi:Chaperone of endosialidase